MDMLTAAVYRKSVRSFSNTKLDDSEIEEIRKYINNSRYLDRNIDTVLDMVEKEYVQESIKEASGYNGFFIDAPYYIIIYSEKSENYIENTGYMGEDIILFLTKKKIDSCWMSIDIQKADKIKMQDRVLSGIIAVGFEQKSAKPSIKQTGWGKGYKNIEKAEFITDNQVRLPIEEIVFDEVFGNKIESTKLHNCGFSDGLFAARYAPSAFNSQPWRFILDKSTVILAMKKDDNTTRYDRRIATGIVMLNFASVIEETLKEIQWKMEKPQKDYKMDDKFEIVGYCVI